jgi:ribose/xylose/arabinose/galactoside ABC-type transport system permease subunit
MANQNERQPGQRVAIGARKILKMLLRRQESGIAIPLILLVVVITIINPVFLTFENIIQVLRGTSFIYIICITMTFVLVSAGLDLSVGSVLGLGGIIAGMVIIRGVPVWLGVLLGILTGTVVGWVNGFIIIRFRIPSLIVTLGMLYFARGIVQVLTRGKPVYPLPAEFNIIGQGDFIGIPYVLMIAVVLAIMGHIVLTQTAFGRAVYAIGGNTETARLSGIRVDRVRLVVYMLCGSAAALSGVLMTARLAVGQANYGVGYELQVIAACIIGGTSMFGGVGTILGSAFGAVFMGVVANGMMLTKVSVFWQNIVIGAIIVIAVGIDQYKREKTGIA